MQGSVKTPARVRKFVPHSPVPPPSAVFQSDVADSADATTVRPPAIARRSLPILRREGFDQLAHDARNVLSALRLYCELLAEPGVLTAGNCHYAQELEAISSTASKLVERLSAPRRAGLRSGDSAETRWTSKPEAEVDTVEREPGSPTHPSGRWPEVGVGPGEGVEDLGRELLDLRPLLTGIAGPRVQLEIASMPCAGRSRLPKEDFTRVMLNLVRNASEAMPEGGRLRITAQYGDGWSFLDHGLIPDEGPRTVTISVEDTGSGVPVEIREEIFLPGFTTRAAASSWPATLHRGLGLSIVRSLVEAAGGTVRLCSAAGRGARFELELPITSGMYEITNTSHLVADSGAKGCIECP